MKTKKLGNWVCVGMLAIGAIGCGSEEGEESLLGIEVYGWGPDEGGVVDFQQGLPAYEGGSFVQLRLTKPEQGQVISSVSERIALGGAEIPPTATGQGLRFEMSVLDAQLNAVASGATPLFGFEGDGERQTYRMMVLPVNDFSPVGSLVQSGGQAVFQQSSFDFRAMSSLDPQAYLGRVGHAVVPVDGGNGALVVGGVDTSAAVAPGRVPSVRRMHDDLQQFDPLSGYFTDLSFSQAVGGPLPNGANRLSVARSHHTVTPLGDERFLVVGGFAQVGDSVEATNSIELIDLKADVGRVVQPLVDEQGFAASLSSARARHTATYRPADGKVVVAGGIGSAGAADIVNTIEVIDLNTGMVEPQAVVMSEARADHAALLMDDETVWLIGGHDGRGALASTERVSLTGSLTTTLAGPPLNRARFGAAAIKISAEGGQEVLVVGGYTSLEGAATGSYEVYSAQRASFFAEAEWKLEGARGNLRAVELPQTGDVVVVSGRDGGGVGATQAEVMRFQRSAVLPYSVRSLAATSHNDRADAEALLLNNGQILLTGGIGLEGERRTTLRSAEYFNPVDPMTDPAGTP